MYGTEHLTFVPCSFHYFVQWINKSTINWQTIILEQYNYLSINCAFVHSLHKIKKIWDC